MIVLLDSSVDAPDGAFHGYQHVPQNQPSFPRSTFKKKENFPSTLIGEAAIIQNGHANSEARSHDERTVNGTSLAGIGTLCKEPTTKLNNHKTMSLKIAVPREDDASKVSDVHLNAMEANTLLHAQFPNPASQAYLRGWLGRDTVHHIRDDDKGILVARDAHTNEIVSFVKWLVHKETAGGAEPAVEDEPWPETCRRVYLDGYAELTQKVRDQAMGKSQYYRKFWEKTTWTPLW